MNDVRPSTNIFEDVVGLSFEHLEHLQSVVVHNDLLWFEVLVLRRREDRWFVHDDW